MKAEKRVLVCRHCGCKVGLWFYGWKHQTGGGKSKQTCGRKLSNVDVEYQKGKAR